MGGDVWGISGVSGKRLVRAVQMLFLWLRIHGEADVLFLMRTKHISLSGRNYI